MTRQSNPESGTLAHCATGDVMMGNTSEKNAKRRRRRAGRRAVIHGASAPVDSQGLHQRVRHARRRRGSRRRAGVRILRHCLDQLFDACLVYRLVGGMDDFHPVIGVAIPVVHGKCIVGAENADLQVVALAREPQLVRPALMRMVSWPPPDS